MKDLVELSARELRDTLKRGEITAREIATAHLEKMENEDPVVRAFITTRPDEVLEQAAEIDRGLQERKLKMGLLTGIPVAIKDNIVTRGIRTTCGSRILENFVPPYDATVVRKLKSSGALIIGKTNCDEFAMGSSTENSAFFSTRNPLDKSRVPGGSSGGSAAAVAAGFAPLALGSDTGGSIRQPAAFCGIVGMKPTYGRVSRYGLIAFASSLEQVGPLARTVRDAAMLLQVLAGHDDRDSTSSPNAAGHYSGELGKEIKALSLGLPRQWLGNHLDSELRTVLDQAIGRLEGMGCTIKEVQLPNFEHALSAYYIIAPAEASSNLARYDGVRYGFRAPQQSGLEQMYRATRSQGFGTEVKRRILIGTYVLSSGYYESYYLKASQVRRLICEDYSRAFEKVDLIVGPTTPTPPFKLAEKVDDPLAMYQSDIFTVPANLAGIPALSLPCGQTSQGLPVGLQIQGPHFSEGLILRLAYAMEQVARSQ